MATGKLKMSVHERMAKARAARVFAPRSGADHALYLKTRKGEKLTDVELEGVLFRKALTLSNSSDPVSARTGAEMLAAIYSGRTRLSKPGPAPGRPRLQKDPPPSTLGLAPEKNGPANAVRPPGPVAPISWVPPVD